MFFLLVGALSNFLLLAHKIGFFFPRTNLALFLRFRDEESKKEAKKSCSKRKATDSTNSGFTPLKKKLNKGEQDKALVESTSKKKKQKSGGLVVRKPTKKQDTDEEVVEFDYDDAPQSQNWMAAFQYE